MMDPGRRAGDRWIAVADRLRTSGSPGSPGSPGSSGSHADRRASSGIAGHRPASPGFAGTSPARSPGVAIRRRWSRGSAGTDLRACVGTDRQSQGEPLAGARDRRSRARLPFAVRGVDAGGDHRRCWWRCARFGRTPRCAGAGRHGPGWRWRSSRRCCGCRRFGRSPSRARSGSSERRPAVARCSLTARTSRSVDRVAGWPSSALCLTATGGQRDFQDSWRPRSPVAPGSHGAKGDISRGERPAGARPAESGRRGAAGGDGWRRLS